MKNAITWFEIPVKNIEKAKKFYETIFHIEMPMMEMMGVKSAIFPIDPEAKGVGGCLSQGEIYQPSSKGVLVYLYGGEDLNVVLSRIEAAGGKVVLTKTSIGENGFMAYFTDNEGNRIGLHSEK